MSILEELLSPLSLKEFKDTHLCRVPYAAPCKASPFCDLISWQLLETIFRGEHEDSWLPKQGKLPTEPCLATGRLTLEQAQEGYCQGRTVLIRRAENLSPELKSIAEDFHRLFSKPIDIQIYCTPPNEEGFDWHIDNEEVFVIQSGGEKEFRLRQNLHTAYEIRCLLKAGDWLYIPAGYWHKAKALTPSFHLSVGVAFKQNTTS